MVSSETSSISSEILDLEDITCPICLRHCTNLQNLNKHLDNEHGFENELPKEETTSLAPPRSQRIHLSPIKDLRSTHSRSNSSLSSIDMKPQNTNNCKTKSVESQSNKTEDIQKLQIVTSHWSPFIKGESRCNYCHRKLSPSRGIINCNKCGRLYCKQHCTNRIKLNPEARFDPISINSRWYRCCHDCFTARPGYNDYGCYTDLTRNFIKIRTERSEDLQLIKLQLENRLVRLLDGLFLLFKSLKINGNFTTLVKFNIRKSHLEQSVVPWKADDTVQSCYICERKFNLIMRKHHCRLCGNIVCDSIETGCSQELSIVNLRENASDLPFHESIDLLLYQQVDIKVRLCCNCLKLVYGSRKFKKDMIETHDSPIMVKYRSMVNVASMIERLLPQLQNCIMIKNLRMNSTETTFSIPTDLQEVAKVRDKLLKSFNMYNLLTRQLILLKPRNEAEKQMQKAVQIRSAQFINKKMLPLKSLESLLCSNNESVIDEDSTPKLEQSNNSKELRKPLDIPTIKLADMVNRLTVQEIKQYREELMVVKEQIFLINSMIEDNKKQRKFDEIKTLTRNLGELEGRAVELEQLLGDQGFK